MLSSREDIGRTLKAEARTGMSPKELFEVVKTRHPKAKRKEIIHAALQAMIEAAIVNPEQAKQLHGLAITQRPLAGEDD